MRYFLLTFFLLNTALAKTADTNHWPFVCQIKISEDFFKDTGAYARKYKSVIENIELVPSTPPTGLNFEVASQPMVFDSEPSWSGSSLEKAHINLQVKGPVFHHKTTTNYTPYVVGTLSLPINGSAELISFKGLDRSNMKYRDLDRHLETKTTIELPKTETSQKSIIHLEVQCRKP